VDRRVLLKDEVGTIFKEGAKVRIALLYPNSYSSGMSNLGVHTVYHIFNQNQDIVCERYFCRKRKGNDYA